jgi:hypothetical protein
MVQVTITFIVGARIAREEVDINREGNSFTSRNL